MVFECWNNRSFERAFRNMDNDVAKLYGQACFHDFHTIPLQMPPRRHNFPLLSRAEWFYVGKDFCIEKRALKQNKETTRWLLL